MGGVIGDMESGLRHLSTNLRQLSEKTSIRAGGRLPVLLVEVYSGISLIYPKLGRGTLLITSINTCYQEGFSSTIYSCPWSSNCSDPLS
jgi:hypothetical protein